MSARTRHDELLDRKRALHLRVARSRRRIDRRLRATADDARELISWRTNVARYPAWALAAALGAGLAASTAFRPKRVTRRLGSALLQRAIGEMTSRLWIELRRVWKDSSADDIGAR